MTRSLCRLSGLKPRNEDSWSTSLTFQRIARSSCPQSCDVSSLPSPSPQKEPALALPSAFVTDWKKSFLLLMAYICDWQSRPVYIYEKTASLTSDVTTSSATSTLLMC